VRSSTYFEFRDLGFQNFLKLKLLSKSSSQIYQPFLKIYENQYFIKSKKSKGNIWNISYKTEDQNSYYIISKKHKNSPPKLQNYWFLFLVTGLHSRLKSGMYRTTKEVRIFLKVERSANSAKYPQKCVSHIHCRPRRSGITSQGHASVCCWHEVKEEKYANDVQPFFSNNVFKKTTKCEPNKCKL